MTMATAISIRDAARWCRSDAVASGLATVPADTPARLRSFARMLAPLAFVTLPVLALDQWSKLYVRAHFSLYHSRPIVPGWLDLTYTLNPGAAFSLFATMPPGFRSVFFIALSIVATVVLIALMMRPKTTMSWSIAFALILAGTIGNLIDRVARGLVIDFIYFHHASFSYPVFNVADSAITIGVALILLLSWLDSPDPAPTPDSPD
jgi:signal peptidase II